MYLTYSILVVAAYILLAKFHKTNTVQDAVDHAIMALLWPSVLALFLVLLANHYISRFFGEEESQ